MEILTLSLIASTLVAATPLIWAAMGGLVSHQGDCSTSPSKA